MFDAGTPMRPTNWSGQYELDIRVAVRTRLSDPALRQQFDSMDICQSVLASFFLRAAAGQYDLREPEQLMALLTQMARNKLAMHARSQYQQRRDVRRLTSVADGLATHPDNTAGPAQQALDRDLLNRAYTLMGPEVRQIADHRILGKNWMRHRREFGRHAGRSTATVLACDG